MQDKSLPVFKLYFALNFPPYLSRGSTEVSDVILRREDMYVRLIRAPRGPEVSGLVREGGREVREIGREESEGREVKGKK